MNGDERATVQVAPGGKAGAESETNVRSADHDGGSGMHVAPEQCGVAEHVMSSDERM